MDYRREIDGLRAFAVIPVILFHAGFDAFGGGFAGVDVFFVISGYLITTVIASDLERGKFSIVNFYERRARRILPVLFLVMLVCIPFAWFWLLPSDMQDFSESLVTISVFASNILFWREAVYFDAGTDLKPLLHTWSLSVEEQYYALFPIFLMLAWRFGRRSILLMLALAGLASLAVAQWGSAAKPDAAFYLLPTRAWELLIGALVAFHMMSENRSVAPRWAQELGGALGMFLLLFAIFVFKETTPFPSVYTLVPTLGTALLILFASPATLVGKFLGWRIFVGIGLISYSAYLWHQPLFAFARHRMLHHPSDLIFLALAVSSLILAYFSWKYIELTFRDRSIISRRNIIIFSAAASLLFATFGLFGIFTNGTYWSKSNLEKVVGIDSRVVVNRGLSSDCEMDYTSSINCRTHDEPEVLVWGDSYAMHLVQGLRSSKNDLKLVQKTVSMCGPFFDIAPVDARYVTSWAERCIKINDQVFEYLKKSPSIQYVVMSSPFRQYVNEGASVMTRDGKVVPGADVAYDAMINTLDRIKSLGKTPVVFSPTPTNGKNIGRCLMRATLFDVAYTECDIDPSESFSRQGSIYNFLKQVEKVNPIVWLNDGLCAEGVCKASIDGLFMYRDDGHLSHEGSAYLGKKMGFYQRLSDGLLKSQ